ncbi:MAG: Rrf2 family transcriptional regulator [Gemmatimonadota bacterium]
MRVTNLTEYSLIIALHLARRRREGAGAVAARELSEQERLPADYVEQILLRLRRAGLVDSVRGAKGGYLLVREAEHVTVRDVMLASDHRIFELNCESQPLDPERCAPSSSCQIRPVWRALQVRIDDLLESVTLADLLRDAAVSAPELIPLAGIPA